MKIAIVYHRLVTRGGAERGVHILARALNADILTSDYSPAQLFPEFSECRVLAHPLVTRHIDRRLGWLSFIPGGLMQIESLRLFRNLDLSHYDALISIGNVCKVIPFKGPRRIHYELSVRTDYRFRRLFAPWINYLERIDQESTQQLPVITCNSEHIRQKIRLRYQRDSEVVYPPFNLSIFKTGKSEGYFLAVERISPEKHIETQLEAFRQAPNQKLLIAGPTRRKDLSYLNKLKQTAPPNVTFLGEVSDSELVELYSHAGAAIQTHPDEDLGLIPLEAMASGKPCLAVNAGGFRETIVNGVTGRLIDLPYPENLAKAIAAFNPCDFNPADCVARAALFNEKHHIDRMRSILESL